MPTRLALTALLLCLASACESLDKTGQSETATVSVQTRNIDGLRQTAVDEFRNEGFLVIGPGPTKGSLVFERDASRMERLSYADLRNGRLVNRATIAFLSSGSQTEMRLRSVLINEPDTAFETFHYPLFGTRSSYRSLLRRIKNRVESGNIPTTTRDPLEKPSLDVPLIPYDDDLTTHGNFDFDDDFDTDFDDDQAPPPLPE